MPTARPRNGQYETSLDGANITRFLFDDEDSGGASHGNSNPNTSDERFPTLVRRDDQMLSASSAALDLALSSSPIPEATSISSNWSSRVNRHRPQQSLSAINGPSSSVHTDVGTLGHRPAALRQSLDLQYISENTPEAPGNGVIGQGNHMMAAPPTLQSSFSSNDVPTVNNASGSNAANSSGNANNHAQQHFHNHNASMGRIPAGVMPNRGHSRELSNDNSTTSGRDQASTFQSIQSALQPSAAPFGPSTQATAPIATAPGSAAPGSTALNPYGSYYGAAAPFVPNGANGAPGNYGMNMLTTGMQQMNVNGGVNGNNMYPGQNFAGYGQVPYNQAAQPRDSQARVIQHRRQMDNEAMSRYQNMPLESFRGQVYELCKDQHGCRYLQKKLEERNEDQVHMIWLETNQHVVELMTDPFGNYLCQKLLEFCNDDDRTILIQNASKDMVRIALNTHGTRALQKMIEYVGTPQQVHLITEALRGRVVELIQDLNGNHVIQKCLNKLTAADAQFIFDAVGGNCVDVGTHRHGCCVLQRCIDHASGDQKLWLIQRITEQSRILVQDPFGNYVVQYIIDLNEPTFTEPIVAMFQGCISQLSRHKFSSNVIEKCLRCSQAPSKDMIVGEMLAPQEIERLIRDSYANYVVQTALEYATPHQKHRLVEAIRPILPTIRNTPYGRRIHAKVSTYDTRGNVSSSGQATPADNTQGQIPLRSASHARGMSGSGPMLHGNPMANGGNPGNQNMDQNMAPFQPNGGMPPPGATVPGSNIQQPPPPFNPGLHNNGFNGSHPSGNPSSQGNGAPWM
ncbi:hypothetical protein ACO1O0_006386 [Amphichorda felina]